MGCSLGQRTSSAGCCWLRARNLHMEQSPCALLHMAWCGIVWCGMVWYSVGLGWYGRVWFCMVWGKKPPHGTVPKCIAARTIEPPLSLFPPHLPNVLHIHTLFPSVPYQTIPRQTTPTQCFTHQTLHPSTLPNHTIPHHTYPMSYTADLAPFL